LLYVHQLSDTCWQFDYYNFFGPLLKSEQYLDKGGSQLNGQIRLYNTMGLLDSTATFKRGKMDGDAYRISDDSFRIVKKYVYQDDSLLSSIDPATQPKDTTRYGHEKESEFPGGAGQWLRYMNVSIRPSASRWVQSN
jgi:protein TonB